MILEIIYIIISFFVFFFISQFFHELMHGILAFILYRAKTKIIIWFYKGIPSMRCALVKGEIGRGVLISGQITGILLLIFAFIFRWVYIPVSIALFINAGIQITYGFYEYFLLYILSKDSYMKYHYILYIISGLITCVLIRDLIISYIGA